MMLRTTVPAIAARVLALTLTACGGTTATGPSASPTGATERLAEAPDASTPGPSESAATPRAMAGLVLGSHVCVENATGQPFDVAFTKYDTGDGAVTLQPNTNACAEGTFSSAPDVKGSITVASGQEIGFNAYNLTLGYPEFCIWNVNGVSYPFCDGYDIGDSNTYNNAKHQLTITRHDDDGWKMFTVRVSSE